MLVFDNVQHAGPAISATLMLMIGAFVAMVTVSVVSIVAMKRRFEKKLRRQVLAADKDIQPSQEENYDFLNENLVKHSIFHLFENVILIH